MTHPDQSAPPPALHSPAHALWLAVATAGLSPYAVGMITEETTLHLQGTEALGQSPEAALAELGDPHAAAREYRKSHLTEQDLSFLAYERHLEAALHRRPVRFLLTWAAPIAALAAITLSDAVRNVTQVLQAGGHLGQLLREGWPLLVPNLLPTLAMILFLTLGTRLIRQDDRLRRLVRLYRLALTLYTLQVSSVMILMFYTALKAVSDTCDCGGLSLLKYADLGGTVIFLVQALIPALALVLTLGWRGRQLRRARHLYGLTEDQVLAG